MVGVAASSTSSWIGGTTSRSLESPDWARMRQSRGLEGGLGEVSPPKTLSLVTEIYSLLLPSQHPGLLSLHARSLLCLYSKPQEVASAL